MKINTNKPLKTLGGAEIKNESGDKVTVGFVVSNVLLTNKSGGKMKMYNLAQRFYSEKEVDIDNADRELVKQAVEQDTQYTNLLTGQVLEELSKSNDTEEKKSNKKK